MLKIHCSGLTMGECRELQRMLKGHQGISKAELEPDLLGIQYRSPSSVQNQVPVFWLAVSTISVTVGPSVAIAAKAALDEAGKDTYKLVKNWLAERFPKAGDSIGVTLYDANGKIIEKIHRGR